MAAQNYVLLERIELNASAASVTFSNIPQSGYTDLKVVMSARNSLSSTDATYVLRLNSTDGTSRVLYANGSVTGSLSSSTVWGYVNASTSTASTFSNAEIYLPNYTSSSAKSVSIDNVDETNATNIAMSLSAGLFSTVTSGVTSLSILACDNNQTNNQTFLQYSTFSLYGLAAVGTTPVIAPKATGGNRIDYDGTYWIHTFNSSGTFTPQTTLSCDYLVVAGGGGAGGGIGGGGGAGGLRSTVTATGGGGTLESALAVASGTAYTVTVGAGGAGGNNTTRGVSGSNSVFSSITSTGGGGGGAGQSSDTQQNGLSGGSGGGQGAFGTSAETNAAGTANQGYQGGSAKSGGNGGGGGGANAVGVNATTTVAGNGGAGVATSITGTSVTYAGGGGGGAYTGETAGTGGAGGGGNGTNNDTAGAVGTINTGGGGGAGGYASSGATGGAGGSGIVIVRYLA